MKKLILTLGLGLCLSSAFSQVVVDEARTVGTYTKSGQQILPQAGDFAISVDATPLMKYAGNIFNGNTDNDNTNWFYNGEDIFRAPAIMGKYFLTDYTAVRAKLHLGFNSITDIDLVTDINNPSENVENKTTRKYNGLGLKVGYEMRRGYGRLQGFFGPEVGLGLVSSSRSYKYGNDLRAGSRTKKTMDGTMFVAELGGFVGVEYFVAPKISIGAEASLGLGFASVSRSKIEIENWNGSGVVTEKNDFAGGANGIGLNTAYSGNLFITFHF